MISESEERLVVLNEPADKNGIRLRAFRERDREFEQHYWRAQKSSSLPWPAALGRAVQSPEDVASTTRPVAGSDSDATGWAIAAAVVVALVILFAAIAFPVYYFGIAAQGAVTFLGVAADNEFTTVHRTQTVRSPSASVTLEPAAGGNRIDLGPQPENGWILTPEILGQLGATGSDVVVRDGPLSATVRLGSR